MSKMYRLKRGNMANLIRNWATESISCNGKKKKSDLRKNGEGQNTAQILLQKGCWLYPLLHNQTPSSKLCQKKSLSDPAPWVISSNLRVLGGAGLRSSIFVLVGRSQEKARAIQPIHIHLWLPSWGNRILLSWNNLHISSQMGNQFWPWKCHLHHSQKFIGKNIISLCFFSSINTNF